MKDDLWRKAAEECGAQVHELGEVLLDVITQACGETGGELDSMAISAYADGLRALDALGLVTITRDHGRRVIAEVRKIR